MAAGREPVRPRPRTNSASARSTASRSCFCRGTAAGTCCRPPEINFRANIDALKRCGVTDIVSLSAVGSLREDFAPGDFVVDRPVHRPHLRARRKAFSGRAASRMSRWRIRSAAGSAMRWSRPGRRPGIAPKRGGTYIVMEGPQFSTLAESELYRSWGCDVIGMTNMPEAKLAREAEICYATVAMVTDYDCWHPGHDAVTVEMIVGCCTPTRRRAKALIGRSSRCCRAHAGPCRQGCDHALDHALITAPERRDPAMLARLDAVAGRVLRHAERHDRT